MVKFYIGNDYGLVAFKATEEIDKENLVKIDFYSDDLSLLCEELSTFSLFDEEKNIIVYNYTPSFKKKKQTKEDDQLFQLLKEINASYNVSFVCESSITRASLDKVKELPVKIIEIKNLDEEECFSLFAQIARKYKKEINKDIFDAFFLQMPTEFDYKSKKTILTDYLRFVNESKKLITYPDKITVDVVKKLIIDKLDDNMFKICALILNNNRKEALKNYRELRMCERLPVELLLNMVSQFRFIALVFYLLDKGYSNDDIGKELDVKPGRIYYLKKDLPSCNYSEVENILYQLAKIEENSRIEQMDIDYQIEILIASR